VVKKSYRDMSRDEWVPRADRGMEREDVDTGALQRIADALERLADLHDPVVQARRAAEAEAEAKRQAEREAYWKELEVWGGLRQKINAIVFGRMSSAFGEPARAARRFFDDVMERTTRRFSRQVGGRWRTEDHAALAEEIAGGFDPLTFDWKTVRLGAKAGAWLESALAEVKTKKETTEGAS
jgi:hypothetical protein